MNVFSHFHNTNIYLSIIFLLTVLIYTAWFFDIVIITIIIVINSFSSFISALNDFVTILFSLSISCPCNPFFFYFF
ncbi:hypothetical protein C1645_763137 [Glomus cerebriforme]|uniref:Uncharacterized protein n=1 Tax=Glomus cerebriforme TaxID=658196 RepID=A0A397T5L7_9GLOM|nr:hypothetical protein C1645_763137 [Glomus cerebriforme]